MTEHVLECFVGSKSCSGRGQVFMAQVSPTPADPALPKILADLGAAKSSGSSSGWDGGARAVSCSSTACCRCPGVEGTFQTIPFQLPAVGREPPTRAGLSKPLIHGLDFHWSKAREGLFPIIPSLLPQSFPNYPTGPRAPLRLL